MTASPRLGFTYLTSGQAAPETAVNEIGAYLESGSGHFIFKDRDLATPPGSPANGDCYLVATSPTGAWTGKAGYIAYYLSTAWIFVTVIEGYTAWINDENVFVGYDGATWNTLASPSGVYQPLDSTLTSLAAYNTNGILTQTAADTFTGRTLTAPAAGITVTNGNGVSGNPTLVLANDLGALEALSGTNTIYYRSAADTWTAVTIGSNLTFSAGTLAATSVGSGGGLLAANNLSDVANAGTSRTNLGLAIGTNVQAWDADLDAVAGVSSNGIFARTGSGTASARTITGTANEVTVTNGDGVSGNPTLSLPSALTFTGKTVTGGSVTPAAAPTTTAIGYLGCPVATHDATYTTVMADAGTAIYHTSGSAHTWTIDSNANVAYPIGTILTFINENAGGVVTLAITSDTLRWGASTGSRSLAANGSATALKVTSTVWRLTGDGIT